MAGSSGYRNPALESRNLTGGTGIEISDGEYAQLSVCKTSGLMETHTIPLDQ